MKLAVPMQIMDISPLELKRKLYPALISLVTLAAIVDCRADQVTDCSAVLALYKSGKFEAAVAGAQEILSKRPRTAPAYDLKGRALLALGRYDEAALAFQAAARIEPGNPGYQKSLKQCLDKQSELLTSPSFSSKPSILEENSAAPNTQPDLQIKTAPGKRMQTQLDRERYESEMAAFEDYGTEGLDALIVVMRADQSSTPAESASAEVAPEFIALVRAGLRAIPREFRDKAGKAGYKVVIAPDVLKVMSTSEAARHPRGYPDGATFRDTLGFTSHGKRQIVIIQPPAGKKNLPDKTVCHEFGHVYDVVMAPRLTKAEAVAQKVGAWPSHSHTPRFKQAYDQDLAALPPEHKAELGYYLQGDQAGQEELFAEMFPLLYCRQPLPGTRLELLRTCFPNVLNEMRWALRAYD